MYLNGGNTMKSELITTYTNRAARLAELDRQIADVEEKLKSPSRTVDDIILHIQLLKERQTLEDTKSLCFS